MNAVLKFVTMVPSPRLGNMKNIRMFDLRAVGPWAMVALLASACRDAPTFTEARTFDSKLTQTPSKKSSNRSVRLEEAAFAEIAKLSPSFAGYFIDSDGAVVLQVADSRDNGTSLAAFRRVTSTDPYFAKANRATRISKAKYSFETLERVRDLVFDSVFLAIPEVRTLDLDEVKNRVTIGIDRRSFGTSNSVVRRKLLDIGVDPAAVEVMSQSATVPTSDASRSRGRMLDTPAAATLSSSWAGLVGGIQINMSAVEPRATESGNGGPGNCSLGFVATHTASGGSPYRAMVTATHCTAVWGAPDSTTFSQGGNFGGTSEIDPNKSSCFPSNWCRMSDAALFRISSTMPSEVGLIARTTFTAWGEAYGSVAVDPYSPYFIVTGTSLPPVGATYHKMGFVTGWTTGLKFQSCVDHKLGDWPDQYVTQCTDQGGAYTRKGDSGGSVFVRLDSNNVALIGITLGTSEAHVWSRIDRIAAEMGGTFSVVREATLASPTLTGTVLPNGTAQVTWSPVSGASEYHVTLDNYTQTCDEWGCYVTGTRQETITTGTSVVDNGYYTRVLGSSETSTDYLKVTVIARSPLTGSRSNSPVPARFQK